MRKGEKKRRSIGEDPRPVPQNPDLAQGPAPGQDLQTAGAAGEGGGEAAPEIPVMTMSKYIFVRKMLFLYRKKTKTKFFKKYFQ